MENNVMIFPDTWEEFEKHYGFYDIKQAYMFGNTRLIPSFRVQQWLNHLDDTNRKKQSQKNKMEAIAALFNKKLGEEFEINDGIRNHKCKITDKGVFIHAGIYNEWWYNSAALAELLTGEAVIVDDK